MKNQTQLANAWSDWQPANKLDRQYQVFIRNTIASMLEGSAAQNQRTATNAINSGRVKHRYNGTGINQVTSPYGDFQVHPDGQIEWLMPGF